MIAPRRGASRRRGATFDPITKKKSVKKINLKKTTHA
jgi:hypothetical protein